MSTNISISGTSKNKEAALKVVNEVYANRDLYNLFKYGIEGEHYEFDADGNYVSLRKPGEDVKYWDPTDGIIYKDYILRPVLEYPGAEELKAKIESTYINDPYINCSINDESLREINLAIAEVGTTYFQTRSYGVVEDVDKAIKEEVYQLKKAGIEKAMASAQAKMVEFKKLYPEEFDKAEKDNKAVYDRIAAEKAE